VTTRGYDPYWGIIIGVVAAYFALGSAAVAQTEYDGCRPLGKETSERSSKKATHQLHDPFAIESRDPVTEARGLSAIDACESVHLGEIEPASASANVDHAAREYSEEESIHGWIYGLIIAGPALLVAFLFSARR
jgi:hypothetical protein